MFSSRGTRACSKRKVSTFELRLCPQGEIRSAAEGTPHKPTTNQGKLMARGEAEMFQA